VGFLGTFVHSSAYAFGVAIPLFALWLASRLATRILFFRSPRLRRGFDVAIIWFLTLLYIGACISSLTDDSSDDIVINSPWDGSVAQVETYLKKHLTDPDSFQAVEYGGVVKAGSGSNSSYHVRCKYRAKNSFGGYVIHHQGFSLDKDGKVTSVEDLPIDFGDSDDD
jgi:hypothetical protein